MTNQSEFTTPEEPVSVLEKINDERSQGHSLRAPLLQSISEYFQSTVVTFYTNHNHWQGGIGDDDATMIQEIISSLPKSTNILLIINSPGGSPHGAERIIKICREYSEEEFYTLVPDKAKSAATMICLGSDKIYMTPTSELGPIDVQVPWGDSLLPAHVIIKSYEELVERCTKTPPHERVEPFLHQLQAYNAADVESLRLARDLAAEIGKKVLQDGMLAYYDEEEISRIITYFSDPENLKSHGRPIFYSDIKKLDYGDFLEVECLEIDNSIMNVIREYNLRVITHMASNDLAKICETTKTSFAYSIKRGA